MHFSLSIGQILQVSLGTFPEGTCQSPEVFYALQGSIYLCIVFREQSIPVKVSDLDQIMTPYLLRTKILSSCSNPKASTHCLNYQCWVFFPNRMNANIFSYYPQKSRKFFPFITEHIKVWYHTNSENNGNLLGSISIWHLSTAMVITQQHTHKHVQMYMYTHTEHISLQ